MPHHEYQQERQNRRETDHHGCDASACAALGDAKLRRRPERHHGHIGRNERDRQRLGEVGEREHDTAPGRIAQAAIHQNAPAQPAARDEQRVVEVLLHDEDGVHTTGRQAGERRDGERLAMAAELARQRVRGEHHRAHHQRVQRVRDLEGEMRVADVQPETQQRRIQHRRVVHHLTRDEEGPVRHVRVRELPVQQLVAKDPRLAHGERREPPERCKHEPQPEQLRSLAPRRAHGGTPSPRVAADAVARTALAPRG
jgi:hypothetical protein